MGKFQAEGKTCTKSWCLIRRTKDHNYRKQGRKAHWMRLREAQRRGQGTDNEHFNSLSQGIGCLSQKQQEASKVIKDVTKYGSIHTFWRMKWRGNRVDENS